MRAVVAAVVMVMAVPGVSDAQDRPAPWVEARGFASISTSIKANQPASGLNQMRVFDFEDRRIKLDVGELVLQGAATVDQPFGFRTDVVTGGWIPRVSAASGLFRDPSTGENYDVRLRLEDRDRSRPDLIDTLYLPDQQGELVQLSNVASVEATTTASRIDRTRSSSGSIPTAARRGSTPPGSSIGSGDMQPSSSQSNCVP